MVLAAAAGDGKIARNPCEFARPPAPDTVERTALAPADAWRLIEDLCANDKDGGPGPVQLAALLAYGCGLRRGELLALRWQDLDLDAGEVRVEHSLYQTGKTVARKAPKTARGRRTVPLPPSVAAALRRARTARDAYLLTFGTKRRAGDPVIRPRAGILHAREPWTPSACAQAWRAALARVDAKRRAALPAGAPYVPLAVHLHDLRHSYGSHLLRQGVRLEVVSRLLGHANSATTLTVYSHLFSDEAARLRRDRRHDGARRRLRRGHACRPDGLPASVNPAVFS